MQHRVRLTLFALALATAVGACRDAPTGVESGPFTEPAFAKGGGKGGNHGGSSPPDGDLVALGQNLFQDINLSVNQNESCQTCHDPSEGFAAPSSAVTQGSVVQGSEAEHFGDRKPPSAAYATLAPIFTSSGNNANGGNFWDGRATGDLLGNPAADQALGPFLNPNEQGMPDKACVIWRVLGSAYAEDFTAQWGDAVLEITFPGDIETTCTTWRSQPGDWVALIPTDRQIVEEAYDNVARSIMAFESSLNVFDSRVDRGDLSPLEKEGQKLFSSKGKCQQCHDTKGSQPVFTEFQFHNLGVPRNPDNPVYGYGMSAFDPGLGGVDGNPAHIGKFRTPTLRNVDVGSRRTYMHNGALVTLRQVVQFYSTRDVLPTCTDESQLQDPAGWGPDVYGCWPPPEYPENLDTQNMGNLGLTDHEVNALVAFMMALTDGTLGG